MTTQQEAIGKAVRIAGGQSALARRIGVSKAVVWSWMDRGRIPAKYCPLIERITADAGEAVSCESLRPDIQWALIRASA